MYTIFFTINCVEQLIFSKTFVDHLQFEQLKFFCLKVKLLESSWFPKINWIRAVDKKNNYFSNGVEQMKNHVEQIFWANEFWADDHDPFQLPGLIFSKFGKKRFRIVFSSSRFSYWIKNCFPRDKRFWVSPVNLSMSELLFLLEIFILLSSLLKDDHLKMLKKLNFKTFQVLYYLKVLSDHKYSFRNNYSLCWLYVRTI